MGELSGASTGGGVAALIYIVIAVLLSFFMARKTDNFLVSVILLIWIFTEPVVSGFYKISIPGVPFNFPPNRILLLLLIVMLGMKYLSGRVNARYIKEHKNQFSLLLIILVGLVVVAMVVNRQYLDLKRMIGIPLELLTFLLLYLVVKEYVTDKLLNAILYAVVIMAVINAFVAIVQVSIAPSFLRTGEVRLAFGNTYRSYGLFPTEYILGSFQIMAIFIVMALYRGKSLLYPIAGLLLVSVLTTFHRLDLIVMVITGFIYLKAYAAKRHGAVFMIVVAMTILIGLSAYEIFKTSGGRSQLVEQRLSADTVSGRFNQFGLVIKALPGSPLGLGSYDNPKYQKLMIDHGHTKAVLLPNGRVGAVGLGVHNGFLGVGIQYGIAAMIIFVILLWKMLIYFYKRANRSLPQTIIPFFAVLIWGLVNVSNGIIVFRSYNIMVLALLCGAFVGAYQKGLIVPKGRSKETSVSKI